MSKDAGNGTRRGMLASLAAGVGVLTVMDAKGGAEAPHCHSSCPTEPGGWLDARTDFRAAADGSTDDSRPLQDAIYAGSSAARPVMLPPGVYRITRPLEIPPNTMLVGSSLGLGFGCRIEPDGCAAFIIGGVKPSFHCSIENLMIWPKGTAPDFIVSIDNSYSITFRNVRIHDCQERIKHAAVLLLGDASTGGHGRCADIIWDNLVVRNDNGQPPIAILAHRGCGSHRFYSPDLENFGVLLEWQGGQIDLIAPYTERAGRYAVNCNTDLDDLDVHLNTFGGTVDCAPSGLGCAIRSSTRNFNSFGTIWAGTAELAVYVYSLPGQSAWFHGLVPNLSGAGKARFSGVPGWRRVVGFSQNPFTASKPVEAQIPSRGQLEERVAVPGVTAGEFWVRAAMTGGARGVQLSAFVSDADMVTVIVQNSLDSPVSLKGLVYVECGVV
jgi:hypothetical protein